MARYLPTLLLLPLAAAHFRVDVPPSAQPDSENQLAEGPCGGAKLDFSGGEVNDFHVGGDAVGMTPTHPQSTWLFRATTDTTGEGGWEQVWPIVLQSGLGKFCQPFVTVPEEWVGKEGLVGVAAHAEDGILYGCAQVKFVEGRRDDTPSECRNTTENFSYSSDAELEALVGDNAGSDADSGDDSGDGGDSGDGDAGGSGDEGAASAVRMGLMSVGAVVAAAAFALA